MGNLLAADTAVAKRLVAAVESRPLSGCAAMGCLHRYSEAAAAAAAVAMLSMMMMLTRRNQSTILRPRLHCQQFRHDSCAFSPDPPSSPAVPASPPGSAQGYGSAYRPKSRTLMPDHTFRTGSA